jgi:hypothetical protein
VTYGAEPWTLTNKIENRIANVGKENTEENKRTNIKKNGYWTKQMNQETHNKFKSPDTVSVIKVGKLE